MKPRKVLIQLEVETHLPLDILRDKTRYDVDIRVSESYVGIETINQVQVNVIRTGRK